MVSLICLCNVISKDFATYQLFFYATEYTTVIWC